MFNKIIKCHGITCLLDPVEIGLERSIHDGQNAINCNFDLLNKRQILQL